MGIFKKIFFGAKYRKVNSTKSFARSLGLSRRSATRFSRAGGKRKYWYSAKYYKATK